MQLPADISTANMADRNWESSEKLALEYCEHGRNLLEAREYPQAKSNYQVAIECDPKSSIAYSGLARTNYHLHDYAAALIAINIAIAHDDTRTDFYHQRALISKCLNDYHQVLADCKIILARSPRHQAARGLQSIALVKTKNYQVALLDFDRHIEVYPQDPYGHCYRGICRTGQLESARTILSLAATSAQKLNNPNFSAQISTFIDKNFLNLD
jgi:tetratricopeptide (TPR) repeat protein